MQKNLFFILFLLGGYKVTKAQDTTQALKLSRLVEFGISANAYRGDLAPGYKTWNQSVHLGIKFIGKRRWNGHFSASVGVVKGENFAYTYPDDLATPNTFFKSNIITGQFDLQYNFIRTPQWIVYISQGIGLMRFQPKNENGEKLIDVLTSRTDDEIYANVSFLLPTNLGALYLIKNKYAVGLQVGFLNTQTDYLDNISMWGNDEGNDNIMMVKFMVAAPLFRKQKYFIEPSIQKERSHH